MPTTISGTTGIANDGTIVSAGSIKATATGFIFPDNTTQATAATNVPVDIQTFNAGDADLTWDKPTGGQTMCKIQVWGGGGGGGRGGAANAAGGGGGGAYNEIVVPLSYMGATATITVGAAGTGRTGSQGAGTAGGNSSVEIASYPGSARTVIAYGGGGGGATATSGAARGGGGGGLLGAGAAGGSTAGTSGFGGKGYHAKPSSTFSDGPSLGTNIDPTAGGYGRDAVIAACSFAGTPTGSVYGGGGGGGGTSSGAQSMYGGGGGGTSTGGTSLFGGAGGANAVGTVPGGGGGSSGTSGTNGSDGAAGRVVITSW